MLHLMPPDSIVIHGARQHNLKGITVEIPRRALTVITGPSGSGKSSLAFDTLYAEGQRRYVESLSSYAKQFLERLSRPSIDRLDGISPAVAIEQKNPTSSSRSTVGTATEIYDYLRLLWARVGRQYCHVCSAPVIVDSPTTVADRMLDEEEAATVIVTFAIPRSSKVSHDLILENLRAMGFVRVLRDGTVHRLDDLPASVKLDSDGVLVAVDRLEVSSANRARLADSVALAFAEGDGQAEIVINDRRLRFSQQARCTRCDTPALQLSPTLFSFNNPRGACPACNGFGAVLEYDESLVVPDPDRTLDQGALDPWTKPRYTGKRRQLRDVASRQEIALDVPWESLPAKHKRLLLYGKSGRFVGVFPFLRGLERKRYKQYIRVFLRQYQRANTCPDCDGARLRPEALSVRVGGSSMGMVGALTADGIAAWLATLELTPFERGVAATILRELDDRVKFLCDVGLGYLSLDRLTRTLSGGEAQRISLANALGSSLVDTLYVLDEPSIGLHPRDVGRLLDLLEKLCAAGNTVVVVEHDLSAIRAADHMIELGPGSGESGGDLVYSGSMNGAEFEGTLTGKYMSGTKRIAVPSTRRVAGPHWLNVGGARLHNLENVDVSVPLETLTVVTGVSGSGKSTLVHDILYRQVAARLKGAHGAKEHLGEPVGHVDTLSGHEQLDDVVLIDQSPIGRTPRSNPVTYVRAFDEIRTLFAAQPLARARGYTPTTFSFNATGGGRCRECEGAGHLHIEMVFMADVFIPCEACEGSRFEPEVLEVKVGGLSIQDVLSMTVDQAIIRFRQQERLGKTLWFLQQVGLGYLRLGQPATTLSGGEAQRLKIARQLARAKRKRERRLYILDEPTTGLHVDDVRTLIKVLDRLVDAGHTVVVIEHHMDIIKRADWVIDMGPDGGADGGHVVAQGAPEEVAESGSHTALYLKEVLETAEAASLAREMA
jgi:excinuclease ABC subunit A